MLSPQSSTLEALEAPTFADLEDCTVPCKALALPHAAFVGTMMRNNADQTTFGKSLVSHARTILVTVPST